MHSPLQTQLKQFYQRNNTPIPTAISSTDFRSFINESIKYISAEDAKYLYDDLTKDKTEFTKEEALQVYLNFQNETWKVYNRVQPQVGVFVFESLIRMQPSQEKDQPTMMVLDRSSYINENKVNIKRSFADILTEDYLKKLINMGANGLINQKQEEKVCKYFYNHWVETNENSFLITETEKPQVQLLKCIWAFDFQKALKIATSVFESLQSLKLNDEQYSSLSEITSLIPGLENLNEVSQILQKYPAIKPLIQGRSAYAIEFKEEILRKHNHNIINNPHELLSLQQHFNQVLQLWNFTQDYFEMIENQLTNPYFKQIVSFINCTIDDKETSEQSVEDFSKLEEIGIIERFLYAKKYYSQQNFQLFKQKIKEKVDIISQIDYILLFGNKKQSEIILQNYLDETSNIEKVALISVYLKTFSQQAKMISSLRTEQKSFYGRFIYVYEWLLDKIDGGISRHEFDKKCLAIQVQRKRKNLTKTFSFDCTNCKAPQIYSVLSKKINIDSKQPKLKGYHYFAKDNRVQIMHCIECMVMLPRCSICLYPITVFNAYAEEMKKNATQKKATNKGEPLNKAVVWCPKCKHGGHFHHVMEWFSDPKRRCPVYNCKCKCSI